MVHELLDRSASPAEHLDRIPEIAESGSSPTREFRIFGPPGTGKTTNLSRQIQRAVDRFGRDAVLVTSFSRTAAAELAGRDLPIDPDRLGTLHSHCWHALGGPEIAESHVEDWNRDHPHLRLTPVKKLRKIDGEEAEDESTNSSCEGDRWLEQLNRYRGMMLPPDAWPSALRDFAAKWCEYKAAQGLLDFTDLIEVALNEVRIAPNDPAVIFADEAQDLNRMQLALIRRWGGRADYFILAADDDQAIMSFTGASPEAILDPEVPPDHKIILKQSYRVPRAVHAVANQLIHQVTRRQEKIYLPRPEEGLFLRLSQGGYKAPEYGILKTASEHLERGQTVMFLVSCAYMLQPLIAVLRKNGIPFHNPYRKSNGFWNPLRRGSKHSSVNRILSLLVSHPDFGENRHDWTHGDVKSWVECLLSRGLLRPGARAVFERADESTPVTLQDLDEIFEPAPLESLLTAFDGDHCRLLGWWRQRVNATFHSRVQFPVEVALAGGPRALADAPKVGVGTIHSVKGGEADAVFLFPDLSQAGDSAYQRVGPPRDSIVRLFYVGLTRARNALYLCQRESSMAVRI